MIQAGKHNPAFDKIVNLLPKVKYAGSQTEIPGGFDPASLLPGRYCWRNYFDAQNRLQYNRLQ
jgi:hypothetical protein